MTSPGIPEDYDAAVNIKVITLFVVSFTPSHSRTTSPGRWLRDEGTALAVASEAVLDQQPVPHHFENAVAPPDKLDIAFCCAPCLGSTCVACSRLSIDSVQTTVDSRLSVIHMWIECKEIRERDMNTVYSFNNHHVAKQLKFIITCRTRKDGSLNARLDSTMIDGSCIDFPTPSIKSARRPSRRMNGSQSSLTSLASMRCFSRTQKAFLPRPARRTG